MRDVGEDPEVRWRSPRRTTCRRSHPSSILQLTFFEQHYFSRCSLVLNWTLASSKNSLYVIRTVLQLQLSFLVLAKTINNTPFPHNSIFFPPGNIAPKTRGPSDNGPPAQAPLST